MNDNEEDGKNVNCEWVHGPFLGASQTHSLTQHKTLCYFQPNYNSNFYITHNFTKFTFN